MLLHLITAAKIIRKRKKGEKSKVKRVKMTCLRLCWHSFRKMENFDFILKWIRIRKLAAKCKNAPKLNQKYVHNYKTNKEERLPKESDGKEHHQPANRRQMFYLNFSWIFMSHLSILEKEVSLVLKWFINISRTCVKDLKLINLSKCRKWRKY